MTRSLVVAGFGSLILALLVVPTAGFFLVPTRGIGLRLVVPHPELAPHRIMPEVRQARRTPWFVLRPVVQPLSSTQAGKRCGKPWRRCEAVRQAMQPEANHEGLATARIVGLSLWLAMAAGQLGGLPLASSVPSARESALTRRAAVLAGAAAISLSSAAGARTPGSEDVGEAIQQILDGREALRKLRTSWADYACIDNEGRACNIDAARKILGGVAPQRGDAAIEVAKVTPLYRIDGAFAAVRKFALNADQTSWGSMLDVESFVEKGEDIAFALKKTDDSFYGVVFASKGTVMLEKIYEEAKQSVDRSLVNFDELIEMLKAAKAPGL